MIEGFMTPAPFCPKIFYTVNFCYQYEGHFVYKIQIKNLFIPVSHKVHKKLSHIVIVLKLSYSLLTQIKT